MGGECKRPLQCVPGLYVATCTHSPLLTETTMTSLNDDQLVQYGERAKGKVVLITGMCQRQPTGVFI